MIRILAVGTDTRAVNSSPVIRRGSRATVPGTRCVDGGYPIARPGASERSGLIGFL